MDIMYVNSRNHSTKQNIDNLKKKSRLKHSEYYSKIFDSIFKYTIINRTFYFLLFLFFYYFLAPVLKPASSGVKFFFNFFLRVFDKICCANLFIEFLKS